MKTLKQLLFFFVFLLTSSTLQAQFWEKLGKRAEEKIEREAEKRVERQVEKKIDKIFNDAENKLDGINTKTPKKDVKLPDSYAFEWKYTMKMETNNMDVKMHYMLKKEATYFGIVMVLDELDTSKSSITIMDRGRKAIITLINMEGQKFYRAMELPDENTEDEDSESTEFKLIKTDVKEILGYDCQGFKVQMDGGVMHFYIAKNAPVTFNRAFGNGQNMPKGLNKELIKEFENGIMLEVEFISDKSEKNNFKSTCIELKSMDYKLDVSDYKSLSEFTKN